jgi:hypothetical protein
MKIDCTQSLEILEWAGTRLQVVFPPGLSTTLAFRDETDTILAVAVYTNYEAQSIEMSIVAESPRWMTRRTIEAAFAYPFRQLKVARVTANTYATNQRSVKMLVRLGFQLEGVLRNYGPDGEPRLVFGLLAEEFVVWEKALRHRRAPPIQMSLQLPKERLTSKPPGQSLH